MTSNFKDVSDFLCSMFYGRCANQSRSIKSKRYRAQ